jgi:hypothetical protein
MVMGHWRCEQSLVRSGRGFSPMSNFAMRRQGSLIDLKQTLARVR